MKLFFLMMCLHGLSSSILSQAPRVPASLTLKLWPGQPPGTTASALTLPETNALAPTLTAGKSVAILSNVSTPTLTLYLPNNGALAKGDAPLLPVVAVFPGGGYYVLAYDLEGTEVCDWLNRIHLACVLVKYRVPQAGPFPQYTAALDDAQRVLGLVREHAAQWHLDPNHVGVLGFSAGAHLVAALGNHFNQRLYPATDAADQLSCRPDFEMLIYPAYLSESDGSLTLDAAIKPVATTPQAFLVQAEDDPVQVENALGYFDSLKSQGVSAEMHLYSTGGHGYGLRQTNLPVTEWPVAAERWLRQVLAPH